MRVLVFATVPSVLYYTEMPLYSTFRLLEGAVRHAFVVKSDFNTTVIRYKKSHNFQNNKAACHSGITQILKDKTSFVFNYAT